MTGSLKPSTLKIWNPLQRRKLRGFAPLPQIKMRTLKQRSGPTKRKHRSTFPHMTLKSLKERAALHFSHTKHMWSQNSMQTEKEQDDYFWPISPNIHPKKKKKKASSKFNEMMKISENQQNSTHFIPFQTQCSFQVKTQNRPPNSFHGGQPGPFIPTAYWPTYTACPNPRRCYCVKQTHHSLLTAVHNYPHFLSAKKEEGTRCDGGTAAH